MIWNTHTEKWNQRPSRRHRTAGRRSKDGVTVLEIARHPRLRGEIRLPGDMGSSLCNIDGQIFSDAGIPVVLFMENYDINRVGCHNTHDNMSNIIWITGPQWLPSPLSPSQGLQIILLLLFCPP
jgi:hypothetical protein